MSGCQEIYFFGNDHTLLSLNMRGLQRMN